MNAMHVRNATHTTRRHTSRRQAPHAPAQQRGVALAVILILLLVMTLLGLASLRGTLMEERMSAGSYDRSLSFQAAEAALREAEAKLQANPATACGGGICAPPAAGADIWADLSDCTIGGLPAIWQPAAVNLLTTGGAQAVQPVYAIELMGKAPPPNNPGCGRDGQPELCEVDYYRVTACSGDPDTGRAMTILQSNYVP